MIISRSFLPRMRNVSDKSCRENQNTLFMFHNFFPKIVSFMRYCGKICKTGQATDDKAVHVGYLRLQTHTQNMQYLLLFHGNNFCKIAPECYVERTLFTWSKYYFITVCTVVQTGFPCNLVTCNCPQFVDLHNTLPARGGIVVKALR
jgi:hypothetical protein